MDAPLRFPDDVPLLTDGVVTLRAHSEADVPALHEQALDPEMLRWTTVPNPSTRETAREFACEIVPDAWREDRAWEFAFDAPDDRGRPRFAGSVALRNERHGRAEISYGAHPWARGRGYVVRALSVLLDWGFRERALRTVLWRAHKGNWASRRVAWRLGFSYDGVERHWLPQRGELYDAWVGALTCDEERSPRTRWLDVPPIAGRSIRLRDYRDGDAARVAEAGADERTAHWLCDFPSPFTHEDALAYIEGRREQRATGRGVTWVVAAPGADELLGQISVFDLAPGEDAEIGYWAHPSARGRGLMTEACAMAVRHCFIPEEDGGLGLRRLSAFTADGNTASRGVVEANGFSERGRLRQESVLRDGRHVDTVVYDLLASEYTGPRPTGSRPASADAS